MDKIKETREWQKHENEDRLVIGRHQFCAPKDTHGSVMSVRQEIVKVAKHSSVCTVIRVRRRKVERNIFSELGCV